MRCCTAATMLLFVCPGWVSAGDIIVGLGPAGAPLVRTLDGQTGLEIDSFFAFDSAFLGGVRVATGDVNGDGTADIITGAGPGGGPHVRVFSGTTGSIIHDFFAFDPLFTGGVFVAAGDINRDGQADIITGGGAGAGPHVRIFDGQTGNLLNDFFAFPPAFAAGVHVAAGDVDGDGALDIITGAGPGGGPHVKVFDGDTNAELRSFFAYDPSFFGGVFVGAGDVNLDGKADIITGPGAGGGPHVKVFDGATENEIRSFFAYDTGFLGGVRVGGGDVNQDGIADIITGTGFDTEANMRVFDGQSSLKTLDVFPFPGALNGVYVSGVNLNLPEPGSFLLLAAGMLGLMFHRRR